MASLPFANDGSFMEQFLKLQQQQQHQQPQQPASHPKAASEDASSAGAAPEPEAAETAATQAASSPSDGDANTDFIAQPTWAGAKPGFCFTTRDGVVGYYRDVPLLEQHRKELEAAKAKPLVLKSKSIVKVLPRKPGAPDAKKRKLEPDAAAGQSGYLAEMARYQSMSCAADTKHDRPLVK